MKNEIAGFVFDMQTNAPLVGAHVWYGDKSGKRLPGGHVAYSSQFADGARYRLPFKPNSYLYCTYVGYAPEMVQTGATYEDTLKYWNPTNFELIYSPVTLPTIDVFPQEKRFDLWPWLLAAGAVYLSRRKG